MRPRYIATVLVLALSGVALAPSGAVFAQAAPQEYVASHPIELAGDSENILSRRDQAILMNRLLAEKQRIVLPQVMRETDVDLWIVAGQNLHEHRCILRHDH